MDIRTLRNRVNLESPFYVASSASSKGTRSRSLTVDYADSIDSHSVDSVDVFWSNLGKRNSNLSQSTERMCPIIRNIRERASRGFVHDEVQLNDDRIISQMYSSYIKDTKVLLNNYLGPSLDGFFRRKSWFLDTTKEGEVKGKEFAEYLLARTKNKSHASNTKQIKNKQTTSLSPNSNRDENQRSVQKKNVRFKDVYESSRSGDESACDDVMTKNIPRSGVGEIRKESFLNAKSRRVSNVAHSKGSPGLSRAIDGIKRHEWGSVRGILKKDGRGTRDFLPFRKSTKRTNIEQNRTKKVDRKFNRRNQIGKKAEKGKANEAEEAESSNLGVEDFVGRSRTESNSSLKWNRSMRLLRGVNLVSEIDKREKSDRSSRLASHLGLPIFSMQPERRSTTPESGSQASTSPTRSQGRDTRGLLEARKGATHPWKGHRKISYADRESRRNASTAKHAIKGRQYGVLGVGKVAEVTTVSSFIRYEFDIPDDLDDNLEHLRIHGYLQS